MDEREKRAEYARRRSQQNVQRRRPASSDQRPGSSRPVSTGPNGQGPRRKSSRARRRRRNLIIRMILLVVLVIIALGGFVFWKKYGSSKEKADLKQYYGIQNNDDLAVVVDDQIMGARDAGTQESSAAGGKFYDGIPYVEYSVVRNYINERFYWDSN